MSQTRGKLGHQPGPLGLLDSVAHAFELRAHLVDRHHEIADLVTPAPGFELAEFTGGDPSNVPFNAPDPPAHAMGNHACDHDHRRE